MLTTSLFLWKPENGFAFWGAWMNRFALDVIPSLLYLIVGNSVTLHQFLLQILHVLLLRAGVIAALQSLLSSFKKLRNGQACAGENGRLPMIAMSEWILIVNNGFPWVAVVFERDVMAVQHLVDWLESAEINVIAN